MILGSLAAGAGAGWDKAIQLEEERNRQNQQQQDRLALADKDQAGRMAAVEKEAELRDASKQAERDAEKQAIIEGVNRMKAAVGKLPEEEQARLRKDPIAFGIWAVENGFTKEGEAFAKAGYYQTVRELNSKKEGSEEAKALKARAEALQKTVAQIRGSGGTSGSKGSKGAPTDPNAYTEDDYKVIREDEGHSTEQKAQAEALARRYNDKDTVNPNRALLAAERGEKVTMSEPEFQKDVDVIPGKQGPDQADRIVRQEQLGVPGAAEQQRMPGRGLVTGGAMDRYIAQRVGQFRQGGGSMPSDTELGAMAAQRLAGDDAGAPDQGDPIEAMRARFRPAAAAPSAGQPAPTAPSSGAEQAGPPVPEPAGPPVPPAAPAPLPKDRTARQNERAKRTVEEQTRNKEPRTKAEIQMRLEQLAQIKNPSPQIQQRIIQLRKRLRALGP